MSDTLFTRTDISLLQHQNTRLQSGLPWRSTVCRAAMNPGMAFQEHVLHLNVCVMAALVQLIPHQSGRSPNTTHIIYLGRSNTSMGGQRWHRTEQWISRAWAVLCFHSEECVSYINSLFPLCCINRLRLSKSEMTAVWGFRVIRKWALLQGSDTAEATHRSSAAEMVPSHTLTPRVPAPFCLLGSHRVTTDPNSASTMINVKPLNLCVFPP